MFEEIILLAISIVAIIGGIRLWTKGSRLRTHGKKVNAIIFKNNFNAMDSNYYPVVRFLTEKQEWITEELTIGYRPAKREGTKQEVIYDPDDPHEVEINSTFNLEILPLILIALGTCGLAFVTLELLGVIQFIAEDRPG